jgi:hypothetical protein
LNGKTIGDALVTPVSALDAKDRIELAGFSSAIELARTFISSVREMTARASVESAAKAR